MYHCRKFQIMKLNSIILFITIAILVGSCNYGEKEIIVVPKNYTGYIIIIYNQNHESQKKYLGSKRVYEIPKSGILKTKFAGNYGNIGLPEFYYGKISASSKIKYVLDLEKLSSKTVVASGGATGVADKNTDGKIEYQLFYIGNKEQTDKAHNDIEKLHIGTLAD